MNENKPKQSALDKLKSNIEDRTNQVISIAKATANLLSISSLEQLLRNERLSVCKGCPLYEEVGREGEVTFRGRCSPNLIFSPFTKQVLPYVEDEVLPKGFIRGCGCTLDNKGNLFPEKTTVIGSGNTCPANKWKNVEFKYLTIKELQDGTHDINDNEKYLKLINLGITRYALENNLQVILKSKENK